MENNILSIIFKQINCFFELTEVDKFCIKNFYLIANLETVKSLKLFRNKYCERIDGIIDYKFSNGWIIFLYKLSHILYKNNYIDTACKIYYLNKIMHSVELYYEVDLPDVFLCEHPIGSVMGRANYGAYFYFCHGCTVGNNKGFYPSIGNFVCMMSGSKILGNSVIGNNVIISANTLVKDTVIPDNMIVFNNGISLVLKENRQDNRILWNI